MDDSGFIVPPPGLIPARPAAAPGGTDPARALPVFTPPPGPGGPAAPARPVWRLHLAGGRSVPVTRAVLLGRNPSASAAPAGAADAELIALDDPTSTVSKTHAALLPDGDRLAVIDLHSTNGVRVDGGPIAPGEANPVASGGTLLLGDLAVRVELS